MTIVFYILTLLEYLSFYYILFGKKFYIRARRRDWWLFCVVFLIMLASLRKWNVGIYVLPSYFVSFLVMYVIFDVSLWDNVRLWLLAAVALSVAESMMNYLLITFFDFREIIRVLLYSSCISALLWMYYATLRKKLGGIVFQLPVRVWCIFVGIMILIAGMMTYFTFVLTMIPQRKLMESVGIGLIVAGGSAICILVVALIYYFNGIQKYQMQNDLLEKYNEQQRLYFLQLLQREQSTRQFRHDIINDLLGLSGYCNSGDYVNIKLYLQEMLDGITEINVRTFDVGNDIVNTILNYYFQPMQAECDIVVTGFMGDEIAVSQRDICTIVANLAQNAVEAVENLNREQREIRFDVNQGNQYLNICVTNTIDKQIVFDRDGLPETTKADKVNHGLGLKNMRKIVEKYQGFCNITVENERYITDIYIKI